ncbi:MAG: SoxR reducing system RseC family protein [Pseudomonadota bacterium]|nr:SoxR reducing system RseC family protein [Pseudomonadota bacterium]
MAITEGVVSAVADDHVVFAYQQQSACDSCRLKNGCGQKLLFGNHNNISEVTIPQLASDLKQGQTVDLYVPNFAITFGVLVGYIVPIVALVIGAVMGEFLTREDWGAIAGGLLGLAISVRLARMIVDRQKHQSWIHPRLLNREHSHGNNSSGGGLCAASSAAADVVRSGARY